MSEIDAVDLSFLLKSQIPSFNQAFRKPRLTLRIIPKTGTHTAARYCAIVIGILQLLLALLPLWILMELNATGTRTTPLAFVLGAGFGELFYDLADLQKSFLAVT